MKVLLSLLLCWSLFCCGQRSDFYPINFKKADSMALAQKGESLKNLPLLTHILTADLKTDVEKFRAIYTWVCTNIENDYNAYLKTKKKRRKIVKDRESFLEWNTSFTPRVFEKLLTHKKTACTGYAYLIKELASFIDLDCKIIDGYGRTPTLQLTKNSLPNHSWNAIHLNGKWYLCDATWSAGRTLITDNGPTFEYAYYDGYFLAEPALFVKNHYPLEPKWALLEEPPTYDTFLQGPIIYKDAFQHNIIPMAPEKMEFETRKNETVSFRLLFDSDPTQKDISLLIHNGTSNTKVAATSTHDQKGHALKYAFKGAGLYDTHIQVNDTIIATYVIRVKKK